MIANTIYHSIDSDSLIATRILPMCGPGAKPDDPITNHDLLPNFQDLLYLPTGVQTKEGFEYKFARPLRG